jgi:hypothetical protein
MKAVDLFSSKKVTACVLAISLAQGTGCTTSRSTSVRFPSTKDLTEHQKVTGSRIPLNPAKQGHSYRESPLTVRGFEETEIRESGYPDVATFLQRRGALR